MARGQKVISEIFLTRLLATKVTSPVLYLVLLLLLYHYMISLSSVL